MTQSDSVVPRRGRWLKRLGWIFRGLLVLVLGLYFVGTSSFFFKGFILPKVGQSLNAEVSASDVEISPFSRVVLHDLKVTPKGAPTLFAATTVTARYGLMAILGGHILVDEVSIVAPTVTVIENPDGTSNLTPLQSTQKSSAPPAATAPAKPSPPPTLDIRSVRLENATIRQVKNRKDGSRETMEIAPINITVSNLKNGGTGQLDFSLALGVDKPGTVLQRRLNGTCTIGLLANLMPGAVNAKATLSIDKATGDFADLALLGGKLDCEVTPMEIKQLTLAFTKAGAPEGQLLVSGPFDGAKMEGKLKVEIRALDRQVLNLVGAASGIDFGTTTINSLNEIELAKGGTLINLGGSLDVAHLQIVRQLQHSPTLDLRFDYSLAVDQATQSLTVKSLKLAGTQTQRSLLLMELTSPMTVGWGNHNNAAGDATLNLAVNDLNLADWKPLVGDAAPSGIANLTLKLLSHQGGQQLTFDFDGRVDQLSARVGQDTLAPLDVRVRVNGQVAALKQVGLKECRLELTQQSQPILTVSSTGTYDNETHAADFQTTVKMMLDRLAALVPQTNFTCRTGQLELTNHIVTKPATQTVTGKLALTGFTGRSGDYEFTDFGTTIDLDLLMAGDQVAIHQAAGSLSSGGKFSATGQYDLGKKTGQIDLKLVDLKENDLRPFLQPSLAGNKLVSVTLNTTASAGLTASGDATVKADLHVANLVVQNPTNHAAATPLELRLRVDAATQKKVFAVHQCQLTLTPTARANNELTLAGTVDCSNSNAITGNLKLTATALDLTAYYDLFAGTNTTTDTPPPADATKAPSTTPVKPAAVAAKEPDPIVLPVHDFTFTAAIDRCYLRELDLTNFQTTVKIDGGHILLKPFQLRLNNAPINSSVDLDLGVPGYKYDIAFTADKIPLAPLVDSFSPTYNSKAYGVLSANIQLKGSGTTGRSLRQSLGGKASLNLTNANIQIVGPRVKSILDKIAWAARAPELSTTPLDYIDVVLRAGNKRIEIAKFTAHSAAVLVESTGSVPIADVFMDSPFNQPIDIYLTRQIANQLHPNTPTEGGYMKLPPLADLIGTIREPDVKTIVAKTAEAVKGAVGTATESVKKGLGWLMKSNQNETNAPAKTKSKD